MALMGLVMGAYRGSPGVATSTDHPSMHRGRVAPVRPRMVRCGLSGPGGHELPPSVEGSSIGQGL